MDANTTPELDRAVMDYQLDMAALFRAFGGELKSCKPPVNATDETKGTIAYTPPSAHRFDESGEYAVKLIKVAIYTLKTLEFNGESDRQKLIIKTLENLLKIPFGVITVTDALGLIVKLVERHWLSILENY